MDRGEAYGFSGRETTPNPSNTEGAPGIPSFYTGKTITGSMVALPWQAITLSSTPPASPRPPPLRPRVQQRIHPSTTKRFRSASKNFRRKSADVTTTVYFISPTRRRVLQCILRSVFSVAPSIIPGSCGSLQIPKGNNAVQGRGCFHTHCKLRKTFD